MVKDNIPPPPRPVALAVALTKREHFAAVAMQGMLAGGNNRGYVGIDPRITADFAIQARRIADAVIAELKEPT